MISTIWIETAAIIKGTQLKSYPKAAYTMTHNTLSYLVCGTTTRCWQSGKTSVEPQSQPWASQSATTTSICSIKRWTPIRLQLAIQVRTETVMIATVCFLLLLTWWPRLALSNSNPLSNINSSSTSLNNLQASHLWAQVSNTYSRWSCYSRQQACKASNHRQFKHLDWPLTQVSTRCWRQHSSLIHRSSIIRQETVTASCFFYKGWTRWRARWSILNLLRSSKMNYSDSNGRRMTIQWNLRRTWRGPHRRSRDMPKKNFCVSSQL